jgi:curved DNA-binding protein CbpA
MRDERKLKRAFRAAALKTHPDIAGDSSVEAFKVVQGAYRTLRAALLEEEGSGAAAAALDDDDVDWAEHDWKWKAKYASSSDPEVMRKHTQEEKARAVAEQLSRMAVAGEMRKKKGKRVIKPISQQRIPSAEEIAAMDSNAKVKIGVGQSSRHSSNGAHDALNSQLQGLHRKSRIKARVAEGAVEDDEIVDVGVHYSTIKAIEDSEEERFMRLARLARDWRKKQGSWRESGTEVKMTPKELLQAAVQGASLGACA